jgi:hypothetical protein
MLTFGKKDRTLGVDNSPIEEVEEAAAPKVRRLAIEPLENRIAPSGVGIGKQVGWGC